MLSFFLRKWILFCPFVCLTFLKFVEKVFQEISQNSQENTCGRASFLIKLQTFKKETLFSCEFGEISANTLFTELSGGSFWKFHFTVVNHGKTSNFDICLLDFIICLFVYHFGWNWPHFRLPKFYCNSIYIPWNVWNTKLWKLPVKEFHYSKVAGLYQFFPEKSTGSQVFLKHSCRVKVKPYFLENLWVAASDVSCIYFSFLFEFSK